MATFIRLVDYKSAEEKEKEFFVAENRFTVKEQKDFSTIPGSPIAYWVTNNFKDIFIVGNKLNLYSTISEGLKTRDNNRFLRLWYEIEDRKKNDKWFYYSKGGGFRRWYGFNEYVINWENNGFELKSFEKSSGTNFKFYLTNALIYSALSSAKLSVRFTSKSFFGGGGSGIVNLQDKLNYILAFTNTKISSAVLSTLSESLNFEVGNVGSLPIIFPKSEKTKYQIDSLTQQNIDISREEWDSRETSWDFKKNELLRRKTSEKIKDAYNNYCAYWKDQFLKLHSNEVELNRIFIDIYNLAEEMTPDVPLDNITILKEESEIKDGELVFKKDIIIKQFISYAMGCMFGRYSLDEEGLVLANKGETIKDFMAKVPAPSFIPDDDNIIPVLEDEYFKDDIVSRFKEFLKVTFGAESLAENLDFIAGALSKSKKGGESSEKIIRDYFLKSFFKDHARTYQKRPIYWLFTSGKGRGFNALVYMHRYDKTLLAKMRTDYLLELEAKLDARMGMLGDSARDKQEKDRLGTLMQELAAYDEKLNNKALAFVDIDLDDGVTANYAKFEGLVEGI